MLLPVYVRPARQASSESCSILTTENTKGAEFAAIFSLASADCFLYANYAMSFWSPNIERRGRIFRIVCGIILLLAALLLAREGMGLGAWIAGAGGAFTLFEGLRGWCILRACKFRTRL